jgi:sulfur-oxidizing protein SoxZ
MSKTRIKIPATATKGQVIQIKTLTQHPMESGRRKNAEGKTIPRKILNKMVCTFNGKTVMEAKMYPAISANPYMAFFAKVEESGTFEFTWTDDSGATFTEKAEIKVA